MELQQLKYFCEVATREHVTRAAEKPFVSQSAISRAVRVDREGFTCPACLSHHSLLLIR
jgi:DNA-binding transcriptional LysR family regulator